MVQGPGESDIPVANLTATTTTRGCLLACPQNEESESSSLVFRQICFYTVRVSETFKGNYSVSERVASQ